MLDTRVVMVAGMAAVLGVSLGTDGKAWLVSQEGTVSVPVDGELFIRTRSALYNLAK